MLVNVSEAYPLEVAVVNLADLKHVKWQLDREIEMNEKERVGVNRVKRHCRPPVC